MRYRRFSALLLALSVAIPFPKGVAAQDCECELPGGAKQSARVAGALGGGMFAGLLAAVLRLKHSKESGAAPMVVPVGPATPIPPAIAVVPGATGGGAEPEQPSSPEPGAAAAPDTRRAPSPAMTARDAAREGLTPPKTATLLPALVMIGVGSLLLGLFLMRERSGRRR